MDARTYLEIEAGMMTRLYKAWAPAAARIYADMTALIAKADFDAARELAHTIEMQTAAEKCREYLKYSMWAFAVFGASQANGKKPVVASGSFNETMTHATDILVQGIVLNATDAATEKALQLIAKAEEEYAKTQKADKPRFVKEFVTFATAGNERMQLIASLHASRLSTWGFAAEADLLGIETYGLDAVLDGRTSDFCRMINGHTFQVQDARTSINAILKVQNPEDLRTAQPWPKQDKESLEVYRAMTTAELTAAGLHIPPFHPGCRTLCTKRSSATVSAKPSVKPVQEDAAETTLRAAFEEIGEKITDAQLDYWNNNVRGGPVQILAKMNGISAIDLMQKLPTLKNLMKIKSSGEISFKTRWADEGIVMNGEAVFDPFTGHMYSNYMDFKAADPQRAADFFKQVHLSLVEASTEAGAELFTVGAAGSLGVYTYSKLGFAPAAADWFSLKESIQLDLMEGGQYHEAFTQLAPANQQALNDLLASPDPKALQALVYLPFRMQGQPVGKFLLNGKSSPLSVKPEDKDVLDNLGGGDA